ncbi:MAG: GNAT family N-acetyltransferase [Promethearchaeota archaeon]
MMVKGKILFRNIAEDDLDAMMFLKEQAGWNQTRKDWMRFISLEPRGCFVGTINGRIIASITTTIVHVDLAWMGMVLVHEKLRGRGIGREIVAHALSHLEKAGVETIMLDATPVGIPLYEKFGFKPISRIRRYTVPLITNNYFKGHLAARKAINRVLSYEHRATGRRPRLFMEKLLDDSKTFLIEDEGELSGFLSSRDGSNLPYIGPLVADDEEVAISALDSCLDSSSTGCSIIDVHEQHAAILNYLESRGGKESRSFTRMYSGTEPRVDYIAKEFFITGPEKG